MRRADSKWSGVTTLTLLVFLSFVPPADGQDKRDLITIEDQIWGFDGRVHTGHFNPVSFLIDNRTEEPIDATASLSRIAGLAGTTGGQIVQPVYIGAGARRWVQFYPYIASDDQSAWQLTIGDLRFDRQRQRRSTLVRDNVRGEKSPPPPVIILDAPGSMTRKPVTVKHFPESIFPPWSSATVGLHTVFMDHAPDWETPRQEALMSWLHRGGRLHLLKNEQGDWPRFSGAMTDLNQPFNRFYVGSGTVRRQNLQRGELGESVVRSAVEPITSPDPDEEPEDLSTAANAGSAVELSDPYGSYANEYTSFGAETPDWLDSGWFQSMRQLTQPEHDWWLIFLLALAYIGLIFPGCWLLSRRSRSFLKVYGAIAGLSVVFSLLFLVIGRRGYGESTTLHTLAISRIEDAGYQSVQEWSALFVTKGDRYTVSAPGQQALYAVLGERQSSGARITAGNSGELVVVIPPFSTQTFVSRRRIPVDGWDLRLQIVRRGSSGLRQLVIRYGPAFPADRVTAMRALYGRKMYHLSCDAEAKTLMLSAETGWLSHYCREYVQDIFSGYGWSFHDDTHADQFYHESMPGLVMRSLAEDGTRDPQTFRLSPDRVRLFVYAKMLSKKQVQVSTDTARFGHILYVRDILFVSAESASEPDAAVSGEPNAEKRVPMTTLQLPVPGSESD